MPAAPTLPRLNRSDALAWYRKNRARTASLFALLAEDAYYTRPISLRNPVVFYEGHLPGFSVNTLIKKGLGRPGVDARLETIFARGIDPEDEASATPRGGIQAWPTRDEVRAFGAACDRLIETALAGDDVEREGVAVLERAEGVFTLLEHEAMHQETLLYMWHRLPSEKKRRPADYRPRVEGAVPAAATVIVPAGAATLGADRAMARFGWDNEFDAHRVDVPAFGVDVHDVTNAAYLDFVEAGGYDDARWWSEADWAWRSSQGVSHPTFWERRAGAWFWRGQFDLVPLPPAWPVYVSHAEASAYARWKERRLMTEAEYHRAAFGTPSGQERAHPWGEASPDATRGNFDFSSWDPVAVGSYAAGVSAWGIHDLVGNGWEWTGSLFAPFEGFRAMPSYPEYSAEFFDGQHYVLKGASPATPRELVRASFRNWFRPQYPYVYATFRCAQTV